MLNRFDSEVSYWLKGGETMLPAHELKFLNKLRHHKDKQDLEDILFINSIETGTFCGD